MRQEFLETIAYLSDLFNNYKYHQYYLSILGIGYEINDTNSYWSLDIVDIQNEEFDKILDIIQKIVGENILFLNDISFIKKYMSNLLIRFKCEHDNIRGWRYICPELYPHIYELEEEIIFTLEKLLNFMKIYPFELFQVMTTNEIIGLRNVCYQKKIPYDINRYISKFIGFTPLAIS